MCPSIRQCLSDSGGGVSPMVMSSKWIRPMLTVDQNTYQHKYWSKLVVWMHHNWWTHTHSYFNYLNINYKYNMHCNWRTRTQIFFKYQNWSAKYSYQYWPQNRSGFSLTNIYKYLIKILVPVAMDFTWFYTYFDQYFISVRILVNG